jgi:hypothetical protein
MRNSPSAECAIDDCIRMAIEEIDPRQSAPDQENLLPNGKQHRAPDHSMLNGTVLIERKSLNATDDSRHAQKLMDIAHSQGKQGFALGKVHSERIINSLPDPKSANRKMVDFSLNQMKKSVCDARDQFSDHAQHVRAIGQLRMLTLADHSTSEGSVGHTVYFLGRMMGALDLKADRTGLIDAIVYVKHPKFVWDEDNSCWFNCLVKKRLTAVSTELTLRLAATFHDRLCRDPSIGADLAKVRMRYFRPISV